MKLGSQVCCRCACRIPESPASQSVNSRIADARHHVGLLSSGYARVRCVRRHRSTGVKRRVSFGSREHTWSHGGCCRGLIRSKSAPVRSQAPLPIYRRSCPRQFGYVFAQRRDLRYLYPGLKLTSWKNTHMHSQQRMHGQAFAGIRLRPAPLVAIRQRKTSLADRRGTCMFTDLKRKRREQGGIDLAYSLNTRKDGYRNGSYTRQTSPLPWRCTPRKNDQSATPSPERVEQGSAVAAIQKRRKGEAAQWGFRASLSILESADQEAVGKRRHRLVVVEWEGP